MPTQKDLLERRANAWDQAKAILRKAEDDDRGLTVEERTEYDRLDSEIDGLTERIERGARAAAIEKEFSTVDRSEIFGRGAIGGDGATLGVEGKGDEYARVFDQWLTEGTQMMDRTDLRLLQSGFRQDDVIKAAAGTGGAAGGYTIPPGFRQKIVEVAKYFGPMLREAELIQTDNGANLQWPTNDDTANVGAILGENVQVTEQDVTLNTASLDAYMYTSKLVRVSLQLIQDSAFDFPAWLQRKLGERIGRILNQHFTTGTGTSQPDGIVTSATVGVTGTGSFATTGGLSYDNLVDLVEALDPAYGGGPGLDSGDGVYPGAADGLKFMFHQSARKALRKLKDGQNRPLWEPSLQAVQADTIMGYRYVINNDMPTLATSSKSLLFGNIRQAYVARLVTDVAALQLNERYADFLQRGYLAFQRADGTMQDAQAVRVFQTTSTA